MFLRFTSHEGNYVGAVIYRGKAPESQGVNLPRNWKKDNIIDLCDLLTLVANEDPRLKQFRENYHHWECAIMAEILGFQGICDPYGNLTVSRAAMKVPYVDPQYEMIRKLQLGWKQ